MCSYYKFKNDVKNKLILYKENDLKIKRSGNWREKTCGHILMEEDGFKNFLFDCKNYIKNNILNINNSKIKLHRYWYHLNSSQVMCINFFYQLIKSEEGKNILLNVIRKLLNNVEINENEKIIEATFEKDIDKIKGENTNFDFYIKLSSGMQFFWEIKYTENGFGKAKKDSKTKEGISHKEKFEKIYMVNFNDTLNYKNNTCTCEEFLENYQINRNVFYVCNENDISIFLIPKDNKKADDELEIIKQYKNVYKIYWEDIIDILNAEVDNYSEYTNYYEKFYNKYFGYKNNTIKNKKKE